jgi:hypothetical protein
MKYHNVSYFKNLGLWPAYGHEPIEHRRGRIVILGLGHQKHEISDRWITIMSYL